MRASGREKERGMLWEVREGRGGADRERERESARMIERRISKQMVAE